MSALIEHEINQTMNALAQIDEELYLLVLRRPWFHGVRAWLLRLERRGLAKRLRDLTDRQRYRRGIRP